MLLSLLHAKYTFQREATLEMQTLGAFQEAVGSQR